MRFSITWEIMWFGLYLKGSNRAFTRYQPEVLPRVSFLLGSITHLLPHNTRLKSLESPLALSQLAKVFDNDDRRKSNVMTCLVGCETKVAK
jgi:hypothetical protein